MKKPKATKPTGTAVSSVRPVKDLTQAADPLIVELQKTLLKEQAAHLIDVEYGRGMGVRLLWPTPEHGAYLLQFALRIGAIERAAVLEIARRFVPTDVAEDLAKAIANERGPLEYEMEATMRFEHRDGAWIELKTEKSEG